MANPRPRTSPPSERTCLRSSNFVYYLFLQDRTEEALARFRAILPKALPSRLQYDYFSCYAAFFEERLADARGIANQYSDYRWTAGESFSRELPLNSMKSKARLH